STRIAECEWRTRGSSLRRAVAASVGVAEVVRIARREVGKLSKGARVMKTNGESPVYRVAADVCFSTDKEGTIILNVHGGRFHSLIQSGSKLWSLLAAHDEGITQAELVGEFLKDDEDVATE